MFIGHAESMKAVQSSVYRDLLVFFCGVYLEFLWPLDGDLLMITEPCFTDKMRA